MSVPNEGDNATHDLPSALTATREWLSGLTDLEELSRAQALAVITAAEEIKGAVAAVQARASVDFVEDVAAEAHADRVEGRLTERGVRRRMSAAHSEVALARRCSPAQADRHVAAARAWCSVLPETMTALTEGRINETKAGIIARETTCLAPAERRLADARLAPAATRLGEKGLAGAAQRACIDLDPESIVRRREEAVASKRVSTRPAPDGMAWLSILGELPDVVGAFASLKAAEADRWVATGDPETDAARAADTRSRGQWMVDTALARLSGRDEGEAQPVEVGLVMDLDALLPAAAGSRGPTDSESAGAAADDGAGKAFRRPREGACEVPGWGAMPASAARARLARLVRRLEGSADDEQRRSGVAIRRLLTTPDGEQLVAMDSRRRFFTGGLRTLIELRDGTCRIPWCDAPIRDIDHARRATDGGSTNSANGWGLCQRHNLDKETPGWAADVTRTGVDPGTGPHEVRLRTPHGPEHDCPAPPPLGVGREPPRGPGPPRTRHEDRGNSRFEIHLEWLLGAA